MKFLREHAKGAQEGDPEYWYGVIEPYCGNLWDTLFYSESAARKCANTLEGTVVIVATRVVMDRDDEDYLPLPVRTKEMELKESKDAVDEARKIFEDVMADAAAKRAKA